MEIRDSARKHGVADDDIRHAWENAMKVATVQYHGNDQVFVIGPDRHGGLLELVGVPADEPTRIIHADRLRPSRYDLRR